MRVSFLASRRRSSTPVDIRLWKQNESQGLPDLRSHYPARPASIPQNGRTLTDDAFDSFICVMTNGKVTENKVGPHRDLLAEFPYVGPPHSAA